MQNYDLILTVLLLFTLLSFKEPQQYNRSSIYGGHVLSIDVISTVDKQ